MASRNRIGITGQFDDNISGKLGKIRDQFDRLGTSKGAKSVLQGIGMGAGISAWNLLQGAITGVVGVMGDSVRMAAEEQAGIAQLDTALKANVASYNGNRDAIEEVISEREKLAFSDGEQRDSLAQLVTRTRDVNEALDIQRQAMDLARAKGIDLAAATNILGKVYGGNVAILTRYGIAVSKGATATEALQEVSRATAGQAKAYANTATGAMESLQIAVEDVQEDIGEQLLPAIRDVSVWLRDEFVPAAGGAGEALGWVNENVGGLPEILSRIGEAAGTVAFNWNMLTDSVGYTTASLNDFRAAERESLDAGWELADQAKGTKAILSDLAETEDEVADNLAAIKTQAKKAADALANVESAADDAREALFGSATGPQELTLELKNARVEGNSLKDKLEALRDKKPTKETRQDIRDTKLEIIDNQKKVVELEGELVKLGRVSLSDHKQTILKLGGAWDDSADELARYLRLVSQVPGVRMPRAAAPNDPNGAGRASGGPVRAGGIYTVGERGSETLVMSPTGGGFVIPNRGGGAASGGAPVVVQLNLDGREIARVVDRHLYYEAARAPRSSYAG